MKLEDKDNLVSVQVSPWGVRREIDKAYLVSVMGSGDDLTEFYIPRWLFRRKGLGNGC